MRLEVDRPVQIEYWSRDGKRLLLRKESQFSGYSDETDQLFSWRIAEKICRAILTSFTGVGVASFSPDG
jgi:hypothetical protein